MSKPMFFYAGIYSDAGDAAADCADIQKLHGSGAIGSYDAQIIVREADGSVRVTKTEKPVEHGAWVGAAAGAGAAILFPVLLPAVVVACRRRRRRLRRAHRPRHEPQGGQAHRREAE